MMKRKRYMTFIEILISLSLLALLVSSLLSFFIIIQNSHSKNKVLFSQVKELQHVDRSLYFVFDKINHFQGLNSPHSTNLFFSENKELFFTFDNGIDFHTYLDSKVLAHIFLDEKGCLCLRICNKEDPSLYKEEHLCCDVTDIQFSFFDKEKGPVEQWDRNNIILPLFVWLKIYKKGEEHSFAFELPYKVLL